VEPDRLLVRPIRGEFPNRKAKRAVLAVAAVAAVGAGTGIATAVSAGDDDAAKTPITGTPLERASAAALEHTGEGRVTETEVGDEESYYEVEVTLDNGRETDVQLDKGFNVVSASADANGDADDDE
jgi:uncharacterized membrane protein YkoI